MTRRVVLALLCGAASSTVVAGVGAWTTSGQGGAQVVVDPVGTLYSGVLLLADGLVAKSIDSGLTWQYLNQLATPLAAGPANTVYATFAELITGGHDEATLYRSTDGGVDWTTIQGGSDIFYSVVLDPFRPAALFRIDTTTIRNAGMLFHSVDRGATWTEVDQGLGLAAGYRISAFAADPKTRDVFYAAVTASFPVVSAPTSLYRTSDSGSSWTPVASGIPGTVTTLVVDPFSSSTLYAGFIAANATGTYKSVDGGATFQQINSLFVRALMADPVRQNHVYIGADSDGVHVTSDGGSSWVPMNAGLPDQATVFALAIDAHGEFLHAAAGAIYEYQLGSTSCLADAHTLCLGNERFAVSADFRATAQAPLSHAMAVPLTSGSGYFWFFDPGNIEIVTKVLGGCLANGSWWVFAAGLTNVEVTLHVTDTITQATKSYSNDAGTAFQPIQDTAAFPCP